jgi:hypothetical protein
MLPTIEYYKPISVSADTAVKSESGAVFRIIVTASAVGVIRLYDNTAASGTVILDAMPVYAGDIIDIPAQFTTGLFFDLVSGTATVTILYL